MPRSWLRALVQAHQTVFIDCGTTTPWIIEAIDNDLPFTAGVLFT
ncbi:deoxyribose operon repressor [Salmonella enterica subsp. arizonae]|uniref:Deoxyribose operon repressor n=1 Tax=Salmonella enterica subsp. arizonae TaxID=59203 RepID=A0A2X4TF34_SALER|nr:deoxyribose operon repressor [Salmonella enterica subsp. arizonae]